MFRELTKLVGADCTYTSFCGYSVSRAGDINGDGYDDVIDGAPSTDGVYLSTGSAHVYYGSPTGISSAWEDLIVAPDGSPNDYFGASVSGAGDVNGDGYDDVIVGSPYDDDSFDGAGSAYVYYGSAAGISNASEDKLRASNAAMWNEFGETVAGVGDVNGDGYDDVLVGSRPLLHDGNPDAIGTAYLYFGSSSGVSSASERRLVASDGERGDSFGVSVAGAGDLNGDGYDDLVVGASADDDTWEDSGSVYVFYGGPDGPSSATEDKLVASDARPGDAFGYSVSVAGDLNGDGFDDLVVGAIEDYNDGARSGSAYIFFGASTGVSRSSEHKVVPSDWDVWDLFGYAVSGAGDVDRDGYDDLLVGAFGNDDDGEDSGSAYLYFGAPAGISRDNELKLLAWDGAAGDYFGYAVSGAGDLNGDGFDDVAVGAPWDDQSDASSVGAVYVFTGGCPSGDLDGDGFECDLDCDDEDSAFHPGAVEDDCADPNDYNCDGSVGYADADGDGWVACDDCDDSDASVSPGAEEGVDDGLDQDCDGAELCYVDADGDGFIDPEGTTLSEDMDCEDPGEGASEALGDDCDDGRADVHPGAIEVCDGIDNDCDGSTDAEGAEGASLWYADADGDGFGDPLSEAWACEHPEGYVADDSDCDDTDDQSYAGAAELPGDGVDQDCDGSDTPAEEEEEEESEARKSCAVGGAPASAPGAGLLLCLGLIGLRRRRSVEESWSINQDWS